MFWVLYLLSVFVQLSDTKKIWGHRHIRVHADPMVSGRVRNLGPWGQD